MKKILTLIFIVSSNLMALGQCSTVAVQISSSDTSFIQLYHAGFFNIPSGFANICEWEVTNFSGDIIHQDSTSGNSFEQGNTSFNHSVLITDSMKATIIITNDIEGIICTMNDTIYWKETEVIPGSFIGNWEVLSSNGGVEEQITSSHEIAFDEKEVKLFPSPAHNYFHIEGSQENYSFNILDSNGRVLEVLTNISNRQEVYISHFPLGIYFIQFWDDENRSLGIKKLIKK